MAMTAMEVQRDSIREATYESSSRQKCRDHWCCIWNRRALAVGLAQRGVRVVLADIDEVGLEQTAEQVRRHSGTASTHVVDVSSVEQVGALKAAALDVYGEVNILINNAGLSCGANFLEHTSDDWRRVFDVNVMGVVNGCQSFLPHLLQHESAHIVNISSLFGIVGIPGQAAYCASKFAVRGLSECLWIELANTRVHLTLVHPGGIATNIVDNARFAVPALHQHLQRTFTRMMPPSKAAEHIIRGVEKKKKRVLITPEAYIGDWLQRLMPIRSGRVFAELMSRAMHLAPFQSTVQLEQSISAPDTPNSKREREVDV